MVSVFMQSIDTLVCSKEQGKGEEFRSDAYVELV